MKRGIKALHTAIASTSLLAGLALSILFILPYATLKAIGDHFAKDGNLQSLTPARYAVLRYPAITAGVLLLGLAITMFARSEASITCLSRFIIWIENVWIRFKQDAGSFWRDAWSARPARWEMLLLAVILCAAIFSRLELIDRPVEYDEAYTFTEFARNPLRSILTDYTAPNNHVFHTILVHFATRIFGDALWSLRLPVFLAGVALVIAAYFLGRILYNRWAGLAAAGLAAGVPVLVYKSVSARGYILVALMTTLAFILGAYLCRHKNYFGWLALSIIAAMGFWTIPIMLYPYGVLFTWLLLCGLTRNITREYRSLRDWLKFLISSAAFTGLLTCIFYLPIMMATGISTILKINTDAISISLGQFIHNLPDKGYNILKEWRLGLPDSLLAAIAVGIILSFVLHRRISRARPSLAVAILIFIPAIMLVQRPDSIARIWLWVVPLLLVLSAAGWSGALSALFKSPTIHKIAVPVAISALVAIFLVWGALFSLGEVPPPDRLGLEDPDAPAVSLYLKSQITPSDIIVVSDCSNARYWYYAIYDRIPENAIRAIKSRPFSRALVLSYSNCQGDDLENVLHHYGPDYGFLNMNTARPIQKIGVVTVFEVYANMEAVNRAYGIQ